MKFLIFTCLLLLSLYSHSQVIADPAVSQITAVSTYGANQNNPQVPLGGSFKLNIPIFNRNLINGLPARSCKIKIGLGSKLVLDPVFSLSSLISSNYFDWTSELNGGQIQITGDLKTNLPANFSNVVALDVKGSIQGNSTITINFLITNHNTTNILSDEDPTNNTSFLGYTVLAPLPVTFTGLTVVKKDCFILVDFFTESEINVNNYDIEISGDGISFVKSGEIAASNQPHYTHRFAVTEANKVPVLFVRVKSTDKDGKFKYSDTRTVNGLCDVEWAMNVSPNPAAISVANVVISARQGIFNGRYTIAISDMAGKVVLIKNMTLTNLHQFNLETGNLAAGQYLIKIQQNNDSRSTVLKWQKY